MIGRLADIGTVALALSAIAGFAARRLRQRRRAHVLRNRPVERVRRLEAENVEMDEILDRIREPKQQ